MSDEPDRNVPDLPAAIAEAFDEWLHRMHGITSSCDHKVEGEGIAEAIAPLLAARERAACAEAWEQGYGRADFEGWRSDYMGGKDREEDHPGHLLPAENPYRTGGL